MKIVGWIVVAEKSEFIAVFHSMLSVFNFNNVVRFRDTGIFYYFCIVEICTAKVRFLYVNAMQYNV